MYLLGTQRNQAEKIRKYTDIKIHSSEILNKNLQ